MVILEIILISKNFNYLIQNINNKSVNEYLVKFSNCFYFEKQTEILMDIFKYMSKKEIITQKYNGIMRIIDNKNINSSNNNIDNNFDVFNIFNNKLENNLIESIDENSFIFIMNQRTLLIFQDIINTKIK